MKTVYVHPAQMRRILSGNLAPIATRYEGIRPGERIEIADPATAFSADGNNANL